MTSNRILASAPGACCVKTVQHSGEAAGQWEEIGPMNTYVSFPPEKSDSYDRIILFFTDIWSPAYINNQLLIDYFASNGYLVVAPDCFEGQPIYKVHQGNVFEGFDLWGWVKPHRERADRLIPGWIDAAKAKYGNEKTKYATIGNCFGAPDVLRLISTDWLAAGAFAHPSFLSEDHFRTVKQPLLLSCAETDPTFPTSSRIRAEEILVEVKADYYIQIFSKVVHGFTNRCDPDIPEQKWAKEESARSILGWFDRFCT